MRLQSSCSLFLLPLFLISTLAMPLAGSSEPESTPNSSILEERGATGLCPNSGQQNICTTGDPYCCNSAGGGHVCTKSQVQCSATTICCNNLNGVSNSLK